MFICEVNAVERFVRNHCIYPWNGDIHEELDYPESVPRFTTDRGSFYLPSKMVRALKISALT